MELKRYTGELKALSEGQGVAVFATLNVIDKDGDVTLPGAFGTQEVAIVPAHNWGSVPLGKAVTSEEGEEAHAALKFNLDSPTAKEWHSALKFDVENGRPLQEWSYGFTVVDSEMGEHEGKRVRFLKRMKVHEVSPVLVGAGENTRTLMLKSADHRRPFADQLAAALQECKDIAQRVVEIRNMRARKGKDISGDRLADIAAISDSLNEMVEAAKALARAAVDDQEEALAELARFEENRFRILTQR